MVVVKKLDNGVQVALEEIPYVKSIAFGIWVKNGTRNERPPENGISHFIEHMLFKGTSKRTAKDIAEQMDALGGQMNAYTTKEYTCYHTRTLDVNFTKALDIMSDIFLNSKFDHMEIEKEKDVIKEEIKMYDDNPEELAHDVFQNHIFRGSSLGMPILGTNSTINSFDENIIRNYYEKNYHTENTVLSLAGNFKINEIMQVLNKLFGQWSRKEKYTPYNTKARYDVSHTSRERDIEQIHLCMGFPAISRESEERYALGIFNTIFGGSMSSMLFQSIREEHGLSYSVYSYPTAFSDAGSFNIYCAMNLNQLKFVMEIIGRQIIKVRAKPIHQELINTTKEQMISNYIIGAESTMNRMIASGSSLLLKNKILSSDIIVEKIRKVGAEDIFDLCQRMFHIMEISWCGVGKISNIEMETTAKNVFS